MSDSKLRRVRIVSDGKFTKVYMVDTGEEIPCVQRVKFEHKVYGRPIAHIEQLFMVDSFDIVAETPSVETSAEAKADADKLRQSL